MTIPRVTETLAELKKEFKIYEELIKARLEAGKTQEEVAKFMHTSISAVGRLETSTTINST